MNEHYPTMVRVYIGLGSNLNAPVTQIEMALTALKNIHNTLFISASSFYQTAPFGFKNQPHFINAAAGFDTQLSAQELLHELHIIEQNQGRRRTQEKNGPRTLDLDILIYGNNTMHDENLTIPHPRMSERAFVLFPLLEIAPDLQLPDGRSISELIKKCSAQDVIKFSRNSC